MEDIKAKEWLDNDLSYTIWNNKYRYNGESFDNWLDRVSGGYAPIRKLIEDKKFIFGGRILASRGVKDRKVTYSNCYVITPPEDNLESIFESASKLARTYSYGGGCGIDVSKLAPRGAKVNNAAKTTSGSTSFMDLFSYVTGLIGQAGRRGALMISIDCTHPDLVDFINLKTNLDVCTKANISVRISDDFMRAVENDEDWTLSFTREASKETITKTVKAKEVFELLAKRNWEMAEPGILYWDRIKGYNMLDNTDFEYAGVNPCAEEPLPAGGSCLLGSINLAEFVINPFTEKAYIDYSSLIYTVTHSVTALNQVLMEGLALHPLDEQKNSVYDWRQIGLGTMGLGDMLIKLGIPYGSEKALRITSVVYGTIAEAAVKASLELAEEKGCYPKCDKEKLVKSSFIDYLELDDNTLEEIREYGLYNSQLLTCAPTGSIGTMFQVSTGVEPNFAFSYTRKTVSLNNKDTYYKVDAKIVADYKKATGNEELPDYFVSSADIKSIDRIKTQAVLQKYIDASISSTINLPESTTVEEVRDIYLEAWKHGLKGITIYRDGCKREGILTTDKTTTSTGLYIKRPKEIEATCSIFKSRGRNYLVLIGFIEDRPYEIFVYPSLRVPSEKEIKGKIIKIKKGHYRFQSDILTINNILNGDLEENEKSVTLYTSMLLRHKVDLKYIIKTTRKINNIIASFSSAICRVLSKYLPVEKEVCPNCGGVLIHEGGCTHCESCEYSKCE